ncbi:MAG: V-type ATPase 116kDa subunit family protein [Spirochaetia bacterium]|jgi:V/A-type H+-transporting ATPase subunit I
MISEMAAVEVIGPLELFTPAVDLIQDSGVLHIVETPLAGAGEPSLLSKIHLSEDQAQQREFCARTSVTLDEMIAEIPAHLARSLGSGRVVKSLYEKWDAATMEAVSARMKVLHARVRTFVRRERNLTDDIGALAVYEKVLAAFAPLVETRELPRDFEMIGVMFERRNRLARDTLRREIERLTAGSFRFLEQPQDGGRVSVLIGFPRRESAKVRAFVSKAGIGDMVFPAHLRDKPFEEAFAALQEELASLRVARRVVRGQMEKFFEENAAEMLALQHLCHDRLSRYDALPKFARTRHAFIVQGWVLKEGLPRLKDALSRISSSVIAVREIPKRTLGIPPVQLENAQPVRSFEPLLSLLPLPRYGTLDPTMFLATFFPPIFGLMLADAGYGFILLAAAGILLAIARGRRIVRSLSFIAAACGFFTVVFGFVFGEFFGEMGRSFGLAPLWQERFSLEAGRSAPTLLGYLILAVAVGALQIVLGLVLGMINARRTRDRNMALGNLARIAGLAVLFFFVGRLAKVLPPIFTSFGYVALLLFLVIMIYQTVHHPLHGVLLPLEILSTVGNILSYARIMAIGMASVVLSLLASMLGGMAGNIVVAVLIVVLVHALNLALGIIDPTIQGLRLHYVEFFSKFYLGGGVPFAPFKKLGGVAS